MSVYFFLPDYIGEETLSGGSACRWYLNEDIAAINDFFNKLGGEDVKVAWVPLDGDVSGGVKPIVEMQHKTVMELRELDPWDAEVVFFFLYMHALYVFVVHCRLFTFPYWAAGYKLFVHLYRGQACFRPAMVVLVLLQVS